MSIEMVAWIRADLQRRLAHRERTDMPYDDCECSEGGPCQPKDPSQSPILSGILPWDDPD